MIWEEIRNDLCRFVLAKLTLKTFFSILRVSRVLPSHTALSISLALLKTSSVTVRGCFPPSVFAKLVNPRVSSPIYLQNVLICLLEKFTLVLGAK